MSTSDRIQNLLVAVLVTCSVVVTVLVVRRELSSSAAVDRQASSHRLIDPQVAIQVGSTGHMIGSPDARLRIVEFADLECPYCAMVETVIDSALATLGDSIAVVFRHFPLRSIHPHAYKAALALECAASQGRMRAFQRVVYARQDSLGILSWDDFARIAAISDRVRFGECVDEARFASRVQEDMKAGAQLGVQATPTFLIGTRLVRGMPSRQAFIQMARQELGR